MHYPPYNAIANVLIRSEKLDEALTWSGELGRWFEKTRHEGIRVLGPAAAPIVRLKHDYRYHFVLKSASREKLIPAAGNAGGSGGAKDSADPSDCGCRRGLVDVGLALRSRALFQISWRESISFRAQKLPMVRCNNYLRCSRW